MADENVLGLTARDLLAGDGDEYTKYVLPVYIRLRAFGYSHHDLTV